MLKRVLVALQSFVALGAITGGWAFVADPTGGRVGMTLDLLAGTPFHDFFLPGVILLGVHGAGSLLGAAMSLFRLRPAGAAAVVLGSLLVGWMVVQVVLIGLQSPLQVLFLWVGLAEVGFGLALHQDLAPRRSP